jgi:hypothetical protein
MNCVFQLGAWLSFQVATLLWCIWPVRKISIQLNLPPGLKILQQTALCTFRFTEHLMKSAIAGKIGVADGNHHEQTSLKLILTGHSQVEWGLVDGDSVQEKRVQLTHLSGALQVQRLLVCRQLGFPTMLVWIMSFFSRMDRVLF